MVEWIGSVAETDALTMGEVEEIAAYWQESARAARGEAAEEVEMVDTAPREVNEEQWKRISEAERGFAEEFGKRNPLA